MKKNRLYMNSASSLVYQIAAMLIGLILPRLMLKQYGSDVNGVVNSVTQMLSVIAMLDFGVGAVVQSALYKPLAEKDNEKISLIYSRTRVYFSYIAKALFAYIIVLCIFYGIFRTELFPWQFTSTLILAISISYFGQYYFGVSNTLLLNADQKVYVVTNVNLVALILNAIVTVILIKLAAPVQVVKLASSVVFALKPVFLHVYVKRNYSVKVVKNPPKDAIKNQWSGLAQHITSSITNSIDNIVLTFVSSFSLISIYNVYVLPLHAIMSLATATSSGYKSFFGKLIVSGTQDELISEFNKYEIVMHYIASIIFATVYVTIVPFVLVYTKGVNDAQYDNLLFGIIISVAYEMYVMRIIYSNIIFAAGKFKETQVYCVIECVINIVLTVALVKPLGLVGVAIGTIASSGYRAISCAYYLKKDVLHRSMSHFGIHMLVDVICAFSVFCFFRLFHFAVNNLYSWFAYAFVVFTVSVFVCTLIHFVAYREEMKKSMDTLIKKVKKNH